VDYRSTRTHAHNERSVEPGEVYTASADAIELRNPHALYSVKVMPHMRSTDARHQNLIYIGNLYVVFIGELSESSVGCGQRIVCLHELRAYQLLLRTVITEADYLCRAAADVNSYHDSHTILSSGLRPSFP
jgi:hypothetical protein